MGAQSGSQSQPVSQVPEVASQVHDEPQSGSHSQPVSQVPEVTSQAQDEPQSGSQPQPASHAEVVLQVQTVTQSGSQVQPESQAAVMLQAQVGRVLPGFEEEPPHALTNTDMTIANRLNIRLSLAVSPTGALLEGLQLSEKYRVWECVMR